ncbi:nucleoside/nucleotide kinase family protein [Georgenia ruanii]|uniref:dephospho-CoA kinase n=1 Tax=Georgenia ruanii TaxID=348442 RepID=UPI00186ACACC|nr:dephospho-CoA kinase [Georgenia ruanii]
MTAPTPAAGGRPAAPSEAAAAVARLVLDALPGHRGPGPFVLGIDGRSGSGKSDLAAAVLPLLRARLGDDAVAGLALEEAYRGWHGLAAGVEAVTAGVLAPLAQGHPGAVTRYDWVTGTLDGDLVVPAPGAPMPRVLVVEGCGAGSAACAPFVHRLVWLEAPEAVRRRRAMARDASSWTHLWAAWEAQEQALLEARDVRAAADLVVRTG